MESLGCLEFKFEIDLVYTERKGDVKCPGLWKTNISMLEEKFTQNIHI